MDYSDDLLAIVDIWRTPGRQALAEGLLGLEPEVGFCVDSERAKEGRVHTPSDFLVSSPLGFGIDGERGGLDFGLQVDLEGCPGWSEVEGSRPSGPQLINQGYD